MSPVDSSRDAVAVSWIAFDAHVGTEFVVREPMLSSGDNRSRTYVAAQCLYEDCGYLFRFALPCDI